jgi:hypothetical protein
VRGRQVTPVEVEEDPGPQTSGLQLTMRSKEWKILTLIRSLLFSIITFLFYIGLAIELFQIFIYQPTRVGFYNVITDYLPFVN